MEGIIQYDQASQKQYPWLKVGEKFWDKYKIHLRQLFLYSYIFCIIMYFFYHLPCSEVQGLIFFSFADECLMLNESVSLKVTDFLLSYIFFVKITRPSLIIHEPFCILPFGGGNSIIWI